LAPFAREEATVKVRVECYSGHKADERPVRFCLGERRIQVEAVADRWYGEDWDYFKVRGDDGNEYILKHLRSEDEWEITLFARS
jgi:hypothetical protein